MDPRDWEKLLYRYLTWTDFNAMNGGFATEQGGSAKHISLPPSKRSEIAEFFEVPDPGTSGETVSYEIYVEPVEGYPNSEGPIILTSKPDRRGGEWRISDQHKNRYELWKPEHGFPDSDDFTDSEEYWGGYPPIIYFVKEDADTFHARAVYESRPEFIAENFPERIQQEWHGLSKHNNFSIIDFNKGGWLEDS